MLMHFLPYLVSWAVLAMIVVFLAIYRRRIGSSSDEMLHVLDAEVGAAQTQAIVGRKLAIVDRWGQILTAVVVLYLIGIGAYILWSMLQDQGVKMS